MNQFDKYDKLLKAFKCHGLKLILHTALYLILTNYNAYSDEKGFRLPEELITDSYFLMNLPLGPNELFQYILTVNSSISVANAHEIANSIIHVSQCFEIDPWILTGLVQQESWFNKGAISKTGASGLTQFTNIGIKEVHDQLGLRGKSGAPIASSEYFNSIIFECVNPSWAHLWQKVNLHEEDPNFYPLIKNELRANTEASLVYGAILLKIFLSYEQLKNIKDEKDLKSSELYFLALQRYNGEPGDIKVNYAKKIFGYLKLLYPKPIDFPFLTDTLF